MRIVFVDLLHLFNAPHGIFSMTAVLRNIGVEVFFVGTRNFKTALTKVRDLKDDLLLYSSFASTIPSYIQFDKLVKEQMPVRSFFGGPGPTYDWPCLAQSTIDAVCLGEGEIASVEYIKTGFQPVHNIFHPGSTLPTEFCPLVDLNKLPFPDRSAVYTEDSLLRNSPSKQFLSGRGCPDDCT
jgi:anaerobic magnesium-protoporphyrin IX monomethyl ester cyclase